MNEADRIRYLRVALVVVGLIFIFGLWPLTIVWPSGWSWHAEGRSYYLEMILAIYATLGVFLILAARDPLAHRSLIWFTVWSSIAHGGIMAVQSFSGDHNIGHLWGDVSALFAVALVLALLTPREVEEGARPQA
jgi:MFS superfamily sulfate permease-like transporter